MLRFRGKSVTTSSVLVAFSLGDVLVAYRRSGLIHKLRISVEIKAEHLSLSTQPVSAGKPGCHMVVLQHKTCYKHPRA